MRNVFGLDPETKRRRMTTGETYARLADEYERKLDPRPTVAQVLDPASPAPSRESAIARCDAIIERCVQGV